MSSSSSTLTGASLDRLLAALDADRDAAGLKYEALRRGLVRFFEWRGCPEPDEYADTTLDRVARKLDEGTAVAAISPYVAGVARFVLKEFWRAKQQHHEVLRALPPPSPFRQPSDRDRKLACIDKCLAALPAAERELILEYYRDDKRQKIENRRTLAARLSVPVSTLRMRAHRLRARLESCVGACAKG